MKLKKILSAITALAMGVTMLFATSITASAVDKGEVNCSTNLEIKNALGGLRKGDSIVINVTSDTSDDENIYAGGSDITINLNGYTLSQVSIYVTQSYEQTIKVNDGTIRGQDSSSGYGSFPLQTNYNTKLICENVKIYGGNGLADGVVEGYGIQCGSSVDRIELNNCYVSSGDSMNATVLSAISGDGGTMITATNTTFARGTGTVSIGYPLIVYATLQNADETTIPLPSYTESTFIVGNGYIPNLIDGNVVDQDDDSVASVQAPVTASATIPQPSYTVTIPATIDFGSQTQALAKYKNSEKDQYDNDVVVTSSFTVSATGVDNLFDDLGQLPQLDVSVTFSGQLKGTTNEENTVSYKGKDFVTGDVIGSFKNDADLADGEKNEFTKTLTLNRTDITAADSYTDTMTFTISIPDSAA